MRKSFAVPGETNVRLEIEGITAGLWWTYLNRDKIDIDFDAFYSDKLVEEVGSRVDRGLQGSESFDVGYSSGFQVDGQVDGA